MQSHLTRGVFRAIVNNEPLASSQCRNRLLNTVRCRPRRSALPHVAHVQRRGLFAFNMAPPSTSQSTALPSETGLKPMRDLMRALSDKSRGPPNGVLVKAFRDFFVVRADSPGVITGFHARMLSTTWKYLRSRSQDGELEPEEYRTIFSTENLENVLFVLSEAQCTKEAHGGVQKLARYAFLELCEDHGFGTNQISRPALIAYINLQSLHGNPDEARHMLEKFWDRLYKTNPSPWLSVLRGYAINNDKYHLKRIPSKLEKYGIRFDSASHDELIQILVEQGHWTAAQTIYECPILNDEEPSISAKATVIKYAIMQGDREWAQPIFESLSLEPITKTLGIILLWEAANVGDTATIIERTKNLVSGNPEAIASLTISCVNDLIEYANSIGDHRLASEMFALTSWWQLRPNMQTHLLRLDSLIQSGNVGETLRAFSELGDITSVALENMPLMNKLITMLCLSKQDDSLFHRVSSLLDPLFENNVRLESDTLAALTHMLLYRHDWEGVSELLRPRLGSYDSEERVKVRKAFTDFIMNLHQDSSNAWEAYGLLQVAFPETGVSMRSEIMTSFYKRNRADLAFLVFGHMRQAEDFARRPKPDTYARCFQGIARTRDATNLETVHNMLKLDVEVDLNTRILDALMLAYAECDMAEKSMEIFREILQSAEGPSEKTIVVFFKMCENHHNGAQEAMKMMSKVKLLEITVDRRMYMAYVEALAAQCEFESAIEALEKMPEEIGCSITRNSIGLLYNAIPYQYWKDEVEKWAKDKHPQLWEQLEAVERFEDDEEGTRFLIRDIEVTL